MHMVSMDEQLTLHLEGQQELEARWGALLTEAEGQLGREAVESWLRDLRPLSLDAERLVLAAPNATSRTWVDKRYVKTLSRIGGELWGGSPSVELVIRKTARAARPAAESNGGAHPVEREPARPRTAASPLFPPI